MLCIGGTGRPPNEVLYEGDGPGEGLCIALAQKDPTSTAVWLIKVYVHIAQGFYLLGFFTTRTIAVDTEPSRIVGFASCPGADRYKIIATSVTEGEQAEIILQMGRCCGGGSSTPGVWVPPPPGGGEPPVGGGDN